MATLGGLAIPDDMVWVDEFSTTQIAQSLKRTLTGVHVIQESTLIIGRSIMLDGGWVTRAELLALRALAEDEDQVHVLVHNTISYDVRFSRNGGSGIDAKAILDCSNPDAAAKYSLKLNLFTGVV